MVPTFRAGGTQGMSDSGDNLLELFPGLARDVRSIVTGVLPSQAIAQLVQAGHIRAGATIADAQIQPASLDLRLGPTAYRLQASFLPGRGATVRQRLQDLSMMELDLTKPTVFERGCVYLVPIVEELSLPEGISAKANPKSTTGRLDIFTRLITDNAEEFERVPEGYRGPLYAEVVPRAFSVAVGAGTRLSQIRFARGNPLSPDAELLNLHKEEVLVYLDENSPGVPSIREGLWVSVDLQGPDQAGVVAYRAKKNAPIIDLARVNHYAVGDFWDPIRASESPRLILNPGDFYILASRERVRVPPLFAAEMVPFDPSVGEFRIHYAGFFDPGFGYGSSDIRGTRAVLEVRAHEVPFVIEHGQVVGRLIYVPVLEKPDKIYGASIGSSYQGQELALSKQFRRPAVEPLPAATGS